MILFYFLRFIKLFRKRPLDKNANCSVHSFLQHDSSTQHSCLRWHRPSLSLGFINSFKVFFFFFSSWSPHRNTKKRKKGKKERKRLFLIFFFFFKLKETIELGMVVVSQSYGLVRFQFNSKEDTIRIPLRNEKTIYTDSIMKKERKMTG